jgi:hypothetical protein
MRFAQRRDLQKSGVTTAARRVRLLHVDRPCGQHGAEVVGVVAVFARGDFHGSRRAGTHVGEAGEIVGGNRLLEPAHVGIVGKHLREAHCLFDRVGAVAVHEQFV